MATGAFADVNFSVSPPYEKITLIPGETFYGSITVINPSSSETDFNYVINVEPFYVDENNETVYGYREDRTLMADWVKLDHETGILKPNSNEEEPITSMIMPGVKRATSISWDETPGIGIFHVLYDVEFEGVKSSVDKYVIVCPLWLLFLIILAIFLIIFRILSAKKHPKSDK